MVKRKMTEGRRNHRRHPVTNPSKDKDNRWETTMNPTKKTPLPGMRAPPALPEYNQDYRSQTITHFYLLDRASRC